MHVITIFFISSMFDDVKTPFSDSTTNQCTDLLEYAAKCATLFSKSTRFAFFAAPLQPRNYNAAMRVPSVKNIALIHLRLELLRVLGAELGHLARRHVDRHERRLHRDAVHRRRRGREERSDELSDDSAIVRPCTHHRSCWQRKTVSCSLVATA